MRSEADGYRKIVNHERTWEEKTSIRGKTFSWTRTEVHTFTLSCGHTTQRRGVSYPKHQILCKECKS